MLDTVSDGHIGDSLGHKPERSAAAGAGANAGHRHPLTKRRIKRHPARRPGQWRKRKRDVGP